MVVFLTSSFVEYQPKKYVPKPVDASNGFVDHLKNTGHAMPDFLSLRAIRLMPGCPTM